MNSDKSIAIDPWLDENGQIHTDAQLREISKSWSAGTWDRFLKETVEGSTSYQREEMISHKAYELALEETNKTLWDDSDLPGCDEDFTHIRRLIRDHLTPRQQHTIRLTFWDGFSERKIAKIFAISRNAVVSQKTAGLKKLKHLITIRLPNSRPYERPVQIRLVQSKGRFADLHEVYKQEVSGNDFGKFRRLT